MQHGTFAESADIPAYRSTGAEWQVRLLQSKCYWHDQTEDVIDTIDRRDEIAAELLRMKQVVAEHHDLRFVYFICSRRRVRFSPSYLPQYSSVTRQLTYYLEVGADKELMKVTAPIRTILDEPKIRFTERALAYQQDSKRNILGSVHEFHHYNAVGLGFASKVHYIGFSESPSREVIQSTHGGLAATLRNVSRAENDIFHYYNLFEVAHAARESTRDEGQILEDALVYYFKPDQQFCQQNAVDLKARLAALGRDLEVDSVGVKVQSEYQNEYFRFFSTAVSAANAHEFWLDPATAEMTAVAAGSDDPG